MKANRRINTTPEVRLRSALHRLGFRFRKDYPIHTETIRTRPDIVFTRARVAVFVDGCFWHRCPRHGQVPRSNRAYWQEKLKRNVERDRQATEALGRAGWTVIRIWEHEAIGSAISRIRTALASRAGVTG